ncbi:PRC-barrel domain-containing protein [Caballeronia grimmiae]
MTAAETRLIATCCRASKMIHADVYNEKNETIGRVDGLSVTPDRSLSTAIIDAGGFLLMKARRVAIPNSAVQADSAEGNRGRRKQGRPEKPAGVRIWQGLTSAANIGRSH